jgi:hypothetical protein
MDKFKPALGWRKRRKIIMSKSDGQRSAGKGSSPRPFSVSQAEYDARWDAIFSRDLKEEPEPEIEDEEEDPDGEALKCLRCGGVDTMYVAPNGMYRVCDQCGNAERILHDDPDY